MTGPGTKPTPRAVHNRPALDRLIRRVGRHQDFKRAMLRSLTSAHRPGLAELETRDDDDLTIALIDAWAVTCDILTFYAERSAQEAYLRTATELSSIRNLARLVGYELRPAKAAGTFLAFTAEDKDPPEEILEYAPPIAVRSLPREGEPPQVFETIETLTARSDWNAMRPRLTSPQVLEADHSEFVLGPDATVPAVGDPIIFQKGHVPVAAMVEPDEFTFLRRVTASKKDDETRLTTVELSLSPTSPAAYAFTFLPLAVGWSYGLSVTGTTLSQLVLNQQWSIGQFATTTALTGIGTVQLTAAILNLAAAPVAAPILPARVAVRAAFFGHNTISSNAGEAKNKPPSTITAAHVTLEPIIKPDDGKAFLYLDRVYDEISEGSVVIVRGAGNEGWLTVEAIEEMSVDGFGMSGRVTRLTTADKATKPAAEGAAAEEIGLWQFAVRSASLLAAPIPLPLAELPIEAAVGEAQGEIGADEIELDRPYLDLGVGKQVAVTGERDDLAGVISSEIREIADNVVNDGRSVLRFTVPLTHALVRATTSVNANVAEATHGETVVTMLGDGDGNTPFKAYPLKDLPLTYVSARTPEGMAPSLEIRVDSVRWDEVPDFRAAGPEDRVYIIRHGEDGATSVVFGDGVTGARPPSGRDNVAAVYRKGAGAIGMVGAGRLTLLAKKPAQIKSATNPLPASGGADGETLAEARQNAPLEIMTLGRVVSLRDYADFARAFAAVAKARADWIWDGLSRPVFLTVAGTGGAELPESGEDFKNLAAALAAAGDPDVEIRIRNFRPVWFKTAARLFIDPAYQPEDVRAAGEAALREAFSFEARALGQPVHKSEVQSLLQCLEGVIGVDLEALHRADEAESLNSHLIAAAAKAGARFEPDPAELLMLSLDQPRLEIET